ncbi:MAG: ABC transporter permease [Bdellovibrionales bacterium]|nr:ABC transporter permease [Bdellovibrionales bacterium]
MFKYVIRRLLLMIPILFGVILITFTLFNLFGGDPAGQAAGKYATAERIEELRHELGMDKSIPLQLIDYIKQVVTFDFGRSWFTKQQISQMILDGAGPSLSLTLPGFFLAQLISISLALLVAYWRHTLFDRGMMFFCLAMLSLSSLVYILFFQYALAYEADLFPISGWDSSWLGRWNFLALPILIFVVISLGSNVLFFRTVFLDELFQDYVRTARSKGVPEKRVLFKHILRNAMIPIITLVVYQMPFLIVGSLLIESFFGIPGLGGLIYQAIQNADFPVIKAMTLIGALLYMFFQLLSDILYAVVDPKVQLK